MTMTPRKLLIWIVLGLLGWTVILAAVILAALAVLAVYRVREALVG